MTSGQWTMGVIWKWRVCPPRERVVPLLDGDGAPVQGEIIELPHKGEGLGVAHQFESGEAEQQRLNAGAVVGLHVVDHQVVQRAAVQGVEHVLQELAGGGEESTVSTTAVCSSRIK